MNFIVKLASFALKIKLLICFIDIYKINVVMNNQAAKHLSLRSLTIFLKYSKSPSTRSNLKMVSLDGVCPILTSIYTLLVKTI